MATPAKSSSPKPVAASAGYSGKSLAEKLGLKAGMRVYLSGAPDDYWLLCGFDPQTIVLATSPGGKLDLAHAFFTSAGKLQSRLPGLAAAIAPNGVLWLSWPKQRSAIPSDLNENLLRKIALPLGLVDVKVCAVDADWSALKLVWRRELR